MKYLLASLFFSFQFYSFAQSTLTLKSEELNAQEEVKEEFIFVP